MFSNNVKSKKKLLQINLCSNILSTGKIAEGIGQCAIEHGWKSYIAYGMTHTNPSTSNTIKIGGRHYLYLPYLESLLFDNHSLGLTCRSATKKLIGEIEKIKPDVIQLHTIHCYYLNLKILFEYLSSLNTPVVWTLHDCWAFTGHCAYFDFVNCRKWEIGCGNCPQKHGYPKSLFVDRSAKNWAEKKELFNSVQFLSIVTVSKWLQGLVERSFLRKHSLSTIYNGVDLSLFRSSDSSSFREKYGLLGKFVMVGVASSWSKRKGIDDYIKLARVIEGSICIVLVGVDKEQQAKLPNSIICVNKTFNVQELVDIYSSADVVLNLSYEETFGMTTVEGFACGTPGIVYDKTASPELVTPETGFVVKAGDLDELLDKIKIIKNKGKNHYSKYCRERAEIFFDSKKCFGDYITLYNRVVSKSNRLNENFDNQP